MLEGVFVKLWGVLYLCNGFGPVVAIMSSLTIT
jgi:hypothetical protein